MNQSISLWGDHIPGYMPEFGQAMPTVTPYLVKQAKPTSAVVICQGGGYYVKPVGEAERLAGWVNSMGMSAFTVDYRVAPYRHPYPLADARRAIQYVRSRATEWNVAPDRIVLLGISAGGHLAASVATYRGPLGLDIADSISHVSPYPNALILGCPVITFGHFRHDKSMTSLLGENPAADMRDLLSAELHVSADTPPTFLWHTAEDEKVPVENSLLFAQALSREHVAFELHVFQRGAHGASIVDSDPYVSRWKDLCAAWLKTNSF